MTDPTTATVLPDDGVLPRSVLAGAHERAFGVYIHVPYCRVRCGYCDFNTYTANELRGTSQADFADVAVEEIAFAARAIRSSDLPERRVSTVFFGGGTPTLLPAEDLSRMLEAVRETWGLAPDAEITTEANPDTVDDKTLETLASAGFTRVSIGMQSAVPHVLNTLDRTHRPEAVPAAVAAAKRAGLDVSVDLIYGTPGETLADWDRSLHEALSYDPHHVSAYALILEPGTKLARQVRRGEVATPDDDLHADMYELADEMLMSAGYDWYEISNWAKTPANRSKHNLAYWTGEDWWAIGPGAHSHIGGVRWWNVKHPAPYAERVRRGISAAQERETLSDDERRLERLLLETRLAQGAPIDLLDTVARERIPHLVDSGLIDSIGVMRGRVVPTLRGRLLADTLIHRLLSSV